MHLTLKLLLRLCISIKLNLFNLTNPEMLSMKKEMQAWKENTIIFIM